MALVEPFANLDLLVAALTEDPDDWMPDTTALLGDWLVTQLG